MIPVTGLASNLFLERCLNGSSPEAVGRGNHNPMTSNVTTALKCQPLLFAEAFPKRSFAISLHGLSASFRYQSRLKIRLLSIETMTATVRDDRLSRSMMFLCLGAALVLLGIQWRAWTADAQSTPPLSARTMKVKGYPSNTIKALTAPPKSSARLIIDLSARQVHVYREQQLVTSYPIAIGQAGWETPLGSFSILEMQRDPKWQHPITGEVIPPGAANPLGKRWIGFLADGRAHIGFHGTNQEELIGQAVSHGCIRMRNRDVIALYDQITIGTPVEVRP